MAGHLAWLAVLFIYFFFFAFPEVVFFFFFFLFAVSIFQFQSETLNLYKITRRKEPTGIAFIPHFLSLFLL